MIHTKKLHKMARKWQNIAAMGRKRISYSSKASSSVANKGHFVVYSSDQKRFSIPLAYLSNEIFIKLFNMSEEEFGLPSEGPITMPCDSLLMEYIVSIIQKGFEKELEKVLLNSLMTSCNSSYASFYLQDTREQLLITGY